MNAGQKSEGSMNYRGTQGRRSDGMGAAVEQIFGAETAWAVDAITHREDESWERYLMRVKENPISRQVKISDLIDNSNLSRLSNITMRDVKRQAKYNAALQYLMTDE